MVGFWKIISAVGLVCYKFLSKKQFPSAETGDDLGQEGPCPVSPDGNLMPLQMPASVVTMKQWIVLKLSQASVEWAKHSEQSEQSFRGPVVVMINALESHLLLSGDSAGVSAHHQSHRDHWGTLYTITIQATDNCQHFFVSVDAIWIEEF